MKGIKNWKNPSIRYDQTRNSIEAIIRARLAEAGVTHGWLESCGASSFCTLMEGMGVLRKEDYFRFPNGDTIQMDDAVMCWINRGGNTRMENRSGDSYIAAAGLFGVKARYLMSPIFQEVREELEAGHGVQLNLVEPGHWIAVIAANHDHLLYMDSWGSRHGLTNHGVHELLGREEFRSNVKPFAIVYEDA